MTATIEPAASEAFRLSPQQRRRWILQQAGVPARSQCVVRIRGELRLAALEDALDRVIERHESLRTQFRRVPGMTFPVQVASNRGPRWRRTDLSELDAGQQESEFERVLQGEREQPLDAEAGAALQPVLVRLSAGDHRLVLTVAALCADSWSLRNVARELAHLYAGGEFSEEDLPVQYWQFSEWQNEVLESEDEDANAGRAYWRRVFEEMPETLRLPFEAPATEGSDFAGGRVVLHLAPAIASGLREWCAREAVSAGEALAACWAILLGRLGSRNDVGIRWAVDGRKYEDLHGSVGLFASYIPVRLTFDGPESFHAMARRSAATLQEAAGWQEYYRDEQFVDTTRGVREAAPGFSYEEWLSGDTLDGAISLVSAAGAIEPLALELCCVSAGAELRLAFLYDAGRYREADVRRLAGYYQTLLGSALADPKAAVGSLSLLPQSERHQLLVGFNETGREYPPVAAVHHLFEQAAERSPEAVAVVCEAERLTYGELNRRANQLAHHLLKRGVAANTPVGLLLERSAGMLVGLLGILKAGGAYLPLDPALPKERLAGMLQDSGAEVLVTQRSLSELGLSGSQRVLLDEEWPQIEQESEADPEVEVQGEDLVYVIYTSGSTGKPKGVAVEHRNLLNYVLGITERLGLAPGSSYATVSTLAADLGNTAVFPALCSGGVLHVLASERAMDPQRWREYLQQQPVDCLKIVPSHLQALLGNGEGEAGRAALPRKVLVLGGEASSWELVERVKRAAPSLRVFNHYGPTEATVGVLTYEVPTPSIQHPASSIQHPATVPLGKPLPNSRVYLLNEQLEPVPLGVAGEVYIGGAGVARGYLHQPELTAARFVRDPFSGDDTSRLYKTGDLGRYLPDGSAEFLGRIDHQVKIRGYRIELGEIESVLSQHPAVREAVVLAREDSPGEKRLAAYVVPSNGVLSASELREHLKQTLPEYMVPAALVSLKGLPLTANGKVDRRALPPPEELEEKQQYVAPRSAVEEVLVGIFEEVLGRERVSVRESFFDLGGHSLLATQVISRVREAFEAEVPLRAVFEAPSVAALAARVEERQRAAEGLKRPPLVRVPREGDRPLSFAQQRLWFIDQLDPGSTLYNVPRTVRLRGPLDRKALQQALEEIVRRHEVLRTTYAARGGEPVQLIAADAAFPLPEVDLRHVPEAEREERARQLCAAEANRPFDLAQGPVIRGQLLQLAEEDHVLALTLHHIASDGWSGGILARELSSLYNAFSAGEPAPLPELPVQYADYAAWQRDWLKGEVLDQQISYWRERLAGAPPVLALPTDRPREEATSYRGAAERFLLPAGVAAGLRELCRQEQATQFMVLLAAFKVLLGRWTGSKDLVVGTDLANREQPETEGLIGFLLNHLVLRTDLSGDPSFREVVRRVRESALGAYAHQDVPFERLVEALRPERSGGHTPLFQVLCVVEKVARAALDLSGLEPVEFGVECPASKFDLSLFVTVSDTELAGAWVYRTDLFDAATIRALSEEFGALLADLIEQPGIPIQDVEVARGENPAPGASSVRRARRRTAALLKN